jgi:signal transduction histidine kinase
MRKRILFVACLFAWTAIAAQQYPFVHYTPKDGLVNSRVRSMYQDSKGRMYFLTFGGLSVYDGARFKNYTVQDGLALDLVNDILETGEDSFLVATNTSRMNVLVRGKMKPFPTDDHFCPVINQFLQCADGSIYVTADEGLFKLNNKKFEPIVGTTPSGITIPTYLGAIVEYHDYLIFATNDLRNYTGLYLYDKKNHKLADAIPGLCCGTMRKDKTGHVWISTCDSLYQLDETLLAAGKLQPAALPVSYRQATPFITASFDFDDSYAWISYNNLELVRAGKDGSLLRITMPDELGQGNIGNIFIDRENIIWISAGGAGIFKLINTALQINKTLPGSSILNAHFVSYRPDTTWCLTGDNRIIRQINGRTQILQANNKTSIYSIRQIGNRVYVLAAYNFYDAGIPSEGTSTLNLRLLRSVSHPNSFVDAVIGDPYGNMINTDRDALVVFHEKKVLFQYPLGASDKIENMQIDHLNRLWVASRSEGLMIFALQPDKPGEYLKLIHRFSDELGHASPRCMVLDKNEVAWIGTRFNGLMGFTLENDQLKKIAHYQIAQGLTDDFITSLGCDSTNNILIGTQTGLDRLIHLSGNTYRLENITKSNGVFGYIHNIWIDKNNRSYAILNNAVLQIAPVRTPKEYVPDLFIEEIKINGEAVHPGNHLRLPYTQRNLSFNIAATAFVNEKQVEYSYRLQGSGNDKWSENSTNPDVNFLNLSPGQYVLDVKASFPSTDYRPRNISYSFEIVPPWWRTKWFLAVGIFCLLAVVAMAIRFYYRRKLGRQRTILEKQQAIQKERTRIATDMHDDMGANLSRIKFLSETIGIKRQREEPIEEDIGKIREYSHSMIDKMGEIVWALNEKNDTLSDLLSYTRAYAVEYLLQNNIHCTVEAPEQFESMFLSGEFRRNIYLTVKEALHNIVKHSQAIRVKMDIITNDRLFIRIADDGIGFDEKNIRPFSNGLANMKKRMSTLGGSLEIKNDDGTTVILSAPLR